MLASITRILALTSVSPALIFGRPVIAQELEYENARVVPNVLPEDSIAGLAIQVSTNRFLRGGNDGTNRQYGEAKVSPEVLERILESMGDGRSVRALTSLRTTLITGDTISHTDRKANSDGFDKDEDVVFVFLDDNEGAFFQIGEEKIPAKRGTVVTFKGNSMMHNTIVPSGSEIRLLGPFASRDLQGVTQYFCGTDEECPYFEFEEDETCCTNIATLPICDIAAPVSTGSCCKGYYTDKCGLTDYISTPCEGTDAGGEYEAFRVLACPNAPTKSPSKAPTTAPSKAPTTAPSKAPSKGPTAAPSKSPSKAKSAKADGGTKSAKSQGGASAKSAKSKEWGGWTNGGSSAKSAKSAKSHPTPVATGGSAKSAKSHQWGGWADGGGSSAKSGKAWVCGWSEPAKEANDGAVGGGVADSALADLLLGLVTEALKSANPDDVAAALEAVVGVVGGV